jgi:hypothetical protein
LEKLEKIPEFHEVTEKSFQIHISEIIDPSQFDNVINYIKNDKESNITSNVNILPITLPKIIFGDFSQNSNEFPNSKTQCTAMAAVVLA